MTDTRDVLAKAEKALEPFAGVIFNDNGDVTYDYSDLRRAHYQYARIALTAIRNHRQKGGDADTSDSRPPEPSGHTNQPGADTSAPATRPEGALDDKPMVRDTERFARLSPDAPATPDYAALRALENAATLGPWSVKDGHEGPKLLDGENYPLLTVGYAGDYSGTAWPEWFDAKVAAFIAAARNAMPALLDAAEASDRLRAAMREAASLIEAGSFSAAYLVLRAALQAEGR